MTWSAAEFQGFRHGYAGTIYKGQGRTLDHTYLYHTHHWRSAASYVALTRQRESAQVFVATRDGARRGAARAADGARRDQGRVGRLGHARTSCRRHCPGERQAERATTAEQRGETKSWWMQLAQQEEQRRDPLKAKVRAAQDVRRQQSALPAREWLIPPYVSRDGCDSLGRGLDSASIAAAVAADAQVKEAKAAPWQHLERAYRDPHTAHAKLEDLIKAEGWRGAAGRVQAEPELLGRLLGRDGMFAGRTAQLNRSHAVSAARSVGRSLVRIAEAEQRAERDYRANVTVQMERDKVGVPKLSPEATSVLEAVHAAANGKHPDVSRDGAESRNRPAVAKVWEEGRRNPTIAAEIDQFKEAARQRLGEEGRGTALRSPQERLALSLPGAEPEHTQALRQVAHDLAAAQRGRTDYETQRTLEAFRQRESQHERTRHRHRPDLGR